MQDRGDWHQKELLECILLKLFALVANEVFFSPKFLFDQQFNVEFEFSVL